MKVVLTRLSTGFIIDGEIGRTTAPLHSVPEITDLFAA